MVYTPCVTSTSFCLVANGLEGPKSGGHTAETTAGSSVMFVLCLLLYKCTRVVISLELFDVIFVPVFSLASAPHLRARSGVNACIRDFGVRTWASHLPLPRKPSAAELGTVQCVLEGVTAEDSEALACTLYARICRRDAAGPRVCSALFSDAQASG